MVLILSLSFGAHDFLHSSDKQKVKADWCNWKDCSVAIAWLQRCAALCSLVRNFRVLHCMFLSISGKFFFLFGKSALQQYSVEFIGFALYLFGFLTGT